MMADRTKDVPLSESPPIEEKLDAALEATFPASDPYSLVVSGELDAGASYASPPCLMHELSEGYFGYMRRAELIALLNELLEGERAGAQALAHIVRSGPDTPAAAALRDIAGDAARSVAMLSGHVSRLGGTPSTRTGAFFDKLIGAVGKDAQMNLLNRGQGWVVHKLRDALPRIGYDELHRDLKQMLEGHEQNIRRVSKSE